MVSLHFVSRKSLNRESEVHVPKTETISSFRSGQASILVGGQEKEPQNLPGGAMENIERGGHRTCDPQACIYTGTSMGMQGKLIRAWSFERILPVDFRVRIWVCDIRITG